MDKAKLRALVNGLLQTKDIRSVTSSEVDDIVDSLVNLGHPSASAVKDVMLSSFKGFHRFLLESVDFSDSNYWIKQIVDILNK